MEDAGARITMIFSDFGVVCSTEKTGPAVTRTMMTRLAAGRPDVIVFELGDGILGAYGVEAILRRPISARRSAAWCSPPMTPWLPGWRGAAAPEFDIDPEVVTGPATDNQVGRDIIRSRTNVTAINAVTDAVELGDTVARSLGLGCRRNDPGRAHCHPRQQRLRRRELLRLVVGHRDSPSRA